MLSEGDAAPAFELPAHDGKPVSLEELRGRWVALWWFVEASTPG